MVERTKAEVFDDFKGKIESVELGESKIDGDDERMRKQFHIVIEPLNVEIGGKTGKMHEWIGLSEKATESTVPEGSVADRYIQEVELLFPEAKKMQTVAEVFDLLVGKCFLFKKVTLGRSYKKYEAKEYWTPKQVVNEKEARKEKK